jgi:hypothetical protein
MLSDIFHTILTVLGAFITYELIEVQRKRKKYRKLLERRDQI